MTNLYDQANIIAIEISIFMKTNESSSDAVIIKKVQQQDEAVLGVSFDPANSL